MKRMWKWGICFLAAGTMVFNLAGCSSGSDSSKQKDGQESSGSEPISESGYPEKTIKVVLPYAAGGDTDLNARLASKYLSEKLGQTVVVSNMTGASGTVASKYVKDAQPDGYEIMFNHNNILLHKILGLADYSYNDYKSGGAIVSDDATGIVVPADSPYETLDDLIKDAENRPGEIIYATQAGAFTTLLGLVMEDQAGIDLNIVDAGGAADQITAMLGGQSDVSAFPYGLVKDQVAAGNMKYLCLFAEDENPLIPGVPTAKEEGLDITLTRKYAFFMPKDTPDEVVQVFADALKKVSENPEFIEESNAMYATPDYMTPEETEQYFAEMETIYAQYQDALKTAQ